MPHMSPAVPPSVDRKHDKRTVLVVDDHSIVRRGLVTLIDEDPCFEVIGEAENEADALVAFRQHRPEVLLVDWSLKRRDSSGLIVTLLREAPELKVLVLSIHDEKTHADLAISAGASGYIMKREAAEKIVEGLKAVLEGSFYLSEKALSGLSTAALKRVTGTNMVPEPSLPEALEEEREPYQGWTVSVVIPVFNSRHTLPSLCEQLVEQLPELDDLQIILVDDGSTDGSADVCEQIRTQYPNHVEYLTLARNFGEHNAVLAGIKHATGDYCVVMDDDLQNPPSQVKVLLRHIAKGFDLVYSYYTKRKHPLYRRLGSWLQGWTASLVLGKPRGLYLSSFKVLNYRVMREVCKYTGPKPYLDAILLRTTANIGTVECEHHERMAGHTGYTWRKLIALWARLIVGFSVWPLRLSSLLVLLVCMYGFSGSHLDPHEWINLSFRCSLILWLALISEYIGRIHLFLNEEPQYVVTRRKLRTSVSVTDVQTELEARARHEKI